MNSWIFFKVGRVNPDVRVPVEFQEYDTFHFRLLSSFFPVLQSFLAQGEHAKSSNGVVVLAKPIVPRENQASTRPYHWASAGCRSRCSTRTDSEIILINTLRYQNLINNYK